MQETILFNSAIESPIGQLILMASIDAGRGIVPALPFRVYGRYAIVYITEGNGEYRDAAGYSQPIMPGDLIFVYPDLAHTYGPARGTVWSEFYLVFDGPAIESWRHFGLLNSKRPIVHLEPIDVWQERFKSIVVPNTLDTPMSMAVILSQLLAILTEIAALQERDPTPDPTSDWLVRACALIGQDLAATQSIAAIAERVGVPYSSFRRRFHQELGLSPMEFRNQRRLDASRDLLRYTGMTTAQIADTLGFTDEYHFSNRFHGRFGQRPGHYRQTHRLKLDHV